MRTARPLLALAVVALLALTGCAPLSRTASMPTWDDSYDADWDAMCACWGYTPPDKPLVWLRDDCVLCSDGTPCYATTASKTGWAGGQFDPYSYSITYCDILTLPHEFSHAVYYAMTGDPGENGDGRCLL